MHSGSKGMQLKVYNRKPRRNLTTYVQPKQLQSQDQ